MLRHAAIRWNYAPASVLENLPESVLSALSVNHACGPTHQHPLATPSEAVGSGWGRADGRELFQRTYAYVAMTDTCPRHPRIPSPDTSASAAGQADSSPAAATRHHTDASASVNPHASHVQAACKVANDGSAPASARDDPLHERAHSPLGSQPARSSTTAAPYTTQEMPRNIRSTTATAHDCASSLQTTGLHPKSAGPGTLHHMPAGGCPNSAGRSHAETLSAASHRSPLPTLGDTNSAAARPHHPASTPSAAGPPHHPGSPPLLGRTTTCSSKASARCPSLAAHSFSTTAVTSIQNPSNAGSSPSSPTSSSSPPSSSPSFSPSPPPSPSSSSPSVDPSDNLIALLENMLPAQRSSLAAALERIDMGNPGNRHHTEALHVNHVSAPSQTEQRPDCQDHLHESQSSPEPAAPTTSDLRVIALTSAIPFIGFGFLDNAIMLSVGDHIDVMFSLRMGLTTLASAGLGNMVACVVGVSAHGIIEQMVRRSKFIQKPRLCPRQKQMDSYKTARVVGSTAGIAFGCLLGMIPLMVTGGLFQ